MSDNNTTPTEISIALCDINITVCQELPALPTKMWGDMRYHHTIKISVVDEWAEYFKYYGSANDFKLHKDILSEADMIFALECIVSDAIAGTYDCAEFFNELGYEDPCEGLKAWQGCKKTLYILNEMGISEEMLYDMSNELSEME